MKNILLIVCSLILCTSCDKEALQMLRRADGMMNSNCDSALFEAMDYNGAIMEYKKAEQEFEKIP